MSTTPYQFIKRGNLFVIPVGPKIDEVPYPTQPYSYNKPQDYSLWVNGKVDEPPFQIDRPRMSTDLYQSVRDDVARYAPVPVTRVAFKRSDHAYVGVIDSKGEPYYFALDSHGISVRPADVNDERVWKTFAALYDRELRSYVSARRRESADEMVDVDRELSAPMRDPALVVSKGLRSSKRCCAGCIEKALPKKQKEDKVKSKPTGKASKKQAGATGKTRYTYPQEKSGGKKPVPEGGADEPEVRHSNPSELANQLGIEVGVLHRTARKLGREGFSQFMQSRVRRFSAKHRLDADWWGTLYEVLRRTENRQVTHE